MANYNPNTNHLLNLLYQSLVLSGVTVGYAFLCKKILKIKLDSLSLKAEDILKLTVLISAGNYTANMLYEKKIIPENPFK